MGHTGVVFEKNTSMVKSEKEKVFREKLTWNGFWVNFCVYL